MITTTIISMIELSILPHSGGILRYCKTWILSCTPTPECIYFIY